PREVCKILLDYYDRTYRYDLERRQKVIPQIDLAGHDPVMAARRLLEKSSFLVSTGASLKQ
ncbi:MAG: hypothetical protein AAF722_20365, partial [Cyanobacteria bacterium P01_C01_bin.70]